MNYTEVTFFRNPYTYRIDKNGCDESYETIDEDGGTVLATLLLWHGEDETIEATAQLFAASTKLAEILESLTDQIAALEGVSSVIDEDLMQGEAFKEAIALLVGLKR